MVLTDGADHNEILRRGVESEAEITRFELVEPRLHEIFVNHAGADAVVDGRAPREAPAAVEGVR